LDLLGKKYMPLYTMKNTVTGEIEDMILSISEMEEMRDAGEWTQLVGAPNLVTHTGNIVNKTPDSWKSHLKNIKKSSGRHVPNSIKL
jgi:hypothetical protein